MRIVHVINNINPKDGGPIEWVRQLSVSLSDAGHISDIVCIDNPDAPWLKEYSIKVVALGNKYGYKYSRHLVPWLKTNAKNYDCVIAHGLWRYASFGVWRALHNSKIPYFIYTHGMLDPWFKRTYPLKHLKKWIVWPWMEYRTLRDARAVLFTCEEERQLARESFWLYKCNEAVTTLGIVAPSGNSKKQTDVFLGRYPHLQGKRLILFLSRIHQKKGCDILLQAFAQIAKQDQTLHLVMAGPAHEDLRKTLQKSAAGLGIDQQLTWTGMISGDMKWGAFHASEVFILPSHQENFGIAVVEALACSVPVLISNKVNIWREIDAGKAGLIENDDLEGTVKLLRRWLALTENEKSRMRQQAKSCFLRNFEIKHATDKLIETLHTHGVTDY